ncbi:ankyrin repeat-containing domain protein [Aspergillus multicolor]|uniref:ankyrin repeat domain-containing protein n=1 Tax=Aspergillus multicolor TaxID=41759 RepID=UPI003CCE1005
MPTFPLFELPEELILRNREPVLDPRSSLAKFTRTSQDSHRLGQLALDGQLFNDGIRRVFKWADRHDRVEPIYNVLDIHLQLVEMQKKLELAADALNLAYREGHVDPMTALLEAGLPPDAKWGRYWPLKLAATHGQLEVMRTLYKAGAKLGHGFDMHQQNETGENFLHNACRGTPGAEGTLHNVQLLVQLGLNVHTHSYTHETPLIPAILPKFPNFVEFLLSRGAHVEQNGLARGDPHEVVESLLRAGAEFDERVGLRLIETTLAFAWTRSLALLLDAWNSRVPAGFDCQRPALLFRAAAMVGNYTVLRELLRLGKAETSYKTNSWGATPLMAAAQANKVDVLEFLTPHVSCFDDRDSDGNTALQIAIRHKAEEAIRLLLPHTTWSSPENPDHSPLVEAARHHRLDPGQDVVDPQQQATYALLAAIQHPKHDTVQMFLSRRDLIKPSVCTGILCDTLRSDNEEAALTLLD